MFTTQLVLVDITWALLTFFIVGFHSTFNRFILEFKLKQLIKKQFEHYLDPRQVAILQKNPDMLKLGGERKEMSFLFSDIVGFTPISEHFKNNDDPEGLCELINDYLDRMTKIINNNVECMEYGAQDIEQYDLENNLSVSVQAGSHALWIEGGAK